MPLMRTPRHVDVELTGRCNLRCRYCYRGEAAPAGELGTAAWTRFFAELGEAAVMSVCLAGGEPFLREDLPELLASARDAGLRFQVLTNGGPVDARAAAAVASGGRCDFVQVSLDGGRAEAHDRARGAGSFAAAVRGVRELRRAGVPVTVRLTVHRGNVGELATAARFLLEELGVAAVSTNAVTALGSCAGAGRGHRDGGEDELLLDTAGRELAMASLLELAERYPGRVTAAAGPLAEARAWAGMVEALRAGAAPGPGEGRLTGCGCAEEQIAVRADGAWIPCLLLPQLVLGRVGVDPLVRVWREAPALEALRGRRATELAGLPACAGCSYAAYCTGNCPAVAIARGGGMLEPAPESCLRSFLEAGGRVPAAAGAAR